MATISKNGFTAEVFDNIGEVVDAQVWSETHVSGSGGGGNSTHINDISIRSKVRTRSRVFVKYPDGTEWAGEADASVPMRCGHKILFRYLEFKDKTELVRYKNLNTGQDWCAPDVLETFYPNRLWAAFLLPAVLVTGGLWALMAMSASRGQVVLTSDYVIGIGVGGVAGVVIAILYSLHRASSRKVSEAYEFKYAVQKAIAA